MMAWLSWQRARQGLCHAMPCHAVLCCAVWQGWAGGRRAVAEEAPSFLLLPPSPALFLVPVCPASSPPGRGPALCLRGTLGWESGGSHRGHRSPLHAPLTTPSYCLNSRPDTRAAPAPSTPTAQHCMARGAQPSIVLVQDRTLLPTGVSPHAGPSMARCPLACPCPLGWLWGWGGL